MIRIVACVVLALSAAQAHAHTKPGRVHCSSADMLIQAELTERQRSLKGLQDWLNAVGEYCGTTDSGTPVRVLEVAGNWEGREVLLLASDAWGAARYMFREDLSWGRR